MKRKKILDLHERGDRHDYPNVVVFARCLQSPRMVATEQHKHTHVVADSTLLRPPGRPRAQQIIRGKNSLVVDALAAPIKWTMKIMTSGS